MSKRRIRRCLTRPNIAACALAVMIALPIGAARSQPATGGTFVAVRTGSHPSFGRIVFDAPVGTPYRLSRDGDRVTVRFSNDIALGPPQAAPRNVARLQASGARAEFTIVPGATVREFRMGEYIVIDVGDATADDAPAASDTQRTGERRIGEQPIAMKTPAPDISAATPTAAGTEARAAPARSPAPPRRVAPPAQPPAKVPMPAEPARPAAEPASSDEAITDFAAARSAPLLASPAETTAPRLQAEASASGKSPSASLPTTSPLSSPGLQLLFSPAPVHPGPVALVVRRAGPVPGSDGPAIVVPFAASVGAAVFRRGDNEYVLFDERRPLDLGGLRGDPIFASASVQLLPGATLLRLQPPPGRITMLSRSPGSWRIGFDPAGAALRPIRPEVSDGQMMFPAEALGDVLTIGDPESGATLLVGTQRRPGQGIGVGRRTPEFILQPTTQGVVIEALSDALALRTVPKGFLLTGRDGGLALSSPATMTDVQLAAARLTRWYQFPAQSTEALSARLASQVQEAAAAPALARGPKRREAAETMIALGMAAEAEALLKLAAEQDPREAASADTAGLIAIAALLAGRADQAGGLADTRLSGTDEITLWRAAQIAVQREGAPEAAAMFASVAPLLLRYPAAMRDRLLPLAVETMILGGEAAAAGPLLSERGDDPKLAFARALLLQSRGDTDAALAAFDGLTDSRDQLLHARAAVRAVDLRLASQRISETEAADSLDKLLYAWRRDARDLALRQRVAALRQQSGAWRVALDLLREAKADFPAQAPAIHERMRETFAALLQSPALDTIRPLDFVALVEENADVLPHATDGILGDRLAERLLALDLPKRAERVLNKLVDAAPNEVARASFAARLAALRLREGDAAGALATLRASAAAGLPAAVQEMRAITFAGAAAKLGDVAAAVSTLSAFDSLAALEAQAAILEQAQDWSEAQRAVRALAARTVPASGDLDDAHRRTLLRLATAAARAGDGVALADLRQREEPRFGAGPLGDMFRLLTADAVRGGADLKRVEREIDLVRALPAGLRALQPRLQ